MTEHILQILYTTGTLQHLFFNSHADCVEHKKKLDKQITSSLKGSLFVFEYNGNHYSIQTNEVINVDTMSAAEWYALRYQAALENRTIEDEVFEQVCQNKYEKQTRQIEEKEQKQQKEQQKEFAKNQAIASLLLSFNTVKQTLKDSSLDPGILAQFDSEFDKWLEFVRIIGNIHTHSVENINDL